MKIYIRENRRGNHQWTMQRLNQSKFEDTKGIIRRRKPTLGAMHRTKTNKTYSTTQKSKRTGNFDPPKHNTAVKPDTLEG